MYTKTSQRSGVSLIEVLVGVAIVAILLALLLPAIQKCRTIASIIREKNKIRQIALALHMYSDKTGHVSSGYILIDILPYIDGGVYKYIVENSEKEGMSSQHIIKTYINEDDISISSNELFKLGSSSYVVNALAHGPKKRGDRHSIFRDGMSNTLEITTRYARIDKLQDNLIYLITTTWFEYIERTGPTYFPVPIDGGRTLLVRSLPPTFANRYTDDVLPGSPEAAVLTFQPRPPVDQCDPRIPQSPYTHGLLAGIADGSVRMISPNISPRTFWAAITPDGGEVLGPDW